MVVFLFDPYTQKNKEVPHDKLYHEIFHNHCRPVNERDHKTIAQQVWTWLCRDITVCQTPSFISWLPHLKPYFNVSDLKALAANNRLGDDSCKKVQDLEFTKQEISSHMDHILVSKATGLIRNYSLIDSSLINHALRSGDPITDPVTALKITRLTSIVRNAPPFTSDRVVYRFVDDDSYLSGKSHVSNSFWSCSRNPLYNPEKHHFGYIVLQIEIPKNIQGAGLLLEGYSVFPEEQELVLPPGSEFTLLDMKNNQEFSHPDPKAVKRIVRVIRMRLQSIKDQPNISDAQERVSTSWKDLFHNKGLWDGPLWISDNEALYVLRFPTDIPAYQRFFITNSGIAVVLWDTDTASAIHIVEIGKTEMHANYFKRFFPSDKRHDKLLIKLLSILGFRMNIWTATIHPHYRECGPHGSKSYNDDILLEQRRFSNVKEITQAFFKKSVPLVKEYKKLVTRDPIRAAIVAAEAGFDRHPTYHFDIQSFLFRRHSALFLSDEQE